MEPIVTKGMTGADVDALVIKTRDNMLNELKLISFREVETKKTS